MDGPQRGFTLVEMVVAVGILALLLAAGGTLMASMHPASLRNAADDFDADFAAARAIASASGNGATIAVLPRATGGFTLRVYSGRPTSTGAVRPENVMPVESSSSLSERTFGKPPFAIFLSSSGYPSGVASYPSIDTSGTVMFGAIAAQPPCPAPAIVLTFTSPQGAVETRTLQCSVAVSGSARAAPSPTPNAPVLVPAHMTAHWTSDSAALRFVAAEFGYAHWFASNTGNACGTVATYASGWPYSAPQDPAESARAPAAPAAPYSWPNNGGGSMDDAPAAFALAPVNGSPGTCSVDIIDDYGQHAGASVQVMGDLSAVPASLTFASPGAGAQSIVFSKSYDSDALKLMWGGNCGALLTVAQSAQNTPPSVGAAPATATLSIVPKGTSGACSLTVSDQYGEPLVVIPITVKSSAALNTWPQKVLMASQGGALAMSAPQHRVTSAEVITALLGGAIAEAATPMRGCLAQALMADGTTVDPAPPQAATLGVRIDPSSGCYIDAAGTPVSAEAIAYEPDGQPATFSVGNQTTCSNSAVILGPWIPSRAGPQAALLVKGGVSSSVCLVALSDGSVTPISPDHGLVTAQIASSSTLSFLVQKDACIRDIDGLVTCYEHITVTPNGIPNCSATQWGVDQKGAGPYPPFNVTPMPTTSAGWQSTFLSALSSVDGSGSNGSGKLAFNLGGCP